MILVSNRYEHYDCRWSKFDIACHKRHYIDYLEVVIDWTGDIQYAAPSHQEKMIEIACKRLHVSRDVLESLTPRKYYGDYMKWLSMMSGTIAVYNNMYSGVILTTAQGLALLKLKDEGLYSGNCPEHYEFE